MFDTHCHVQFNGFKNDAEEVVKKCGEKNMILNLVGTQKDTSRAGVEMAERFPFTYASIGLHPVHLFSTHIDEEESSFLSREEDFDYEYYKKLGQSKKVIAVGECGLDLYRLPEGKTVEEVLEKQKKTFTLQYKLAQELGVALVIHVREAHQEMIDLLKELMAEYGNKSVRGTVHCYTGNWFFAKQYLDLGLCIGFTGVITFPPKKSNPQNQTDLLEAVKNIPLERIVVETDSPYLAPIPFRGQRCEPPMVEHTIRKIAELKNISFLDAEVATTQNAQKLFNISL
ncbi:MAG: TatD family hydrolase [Candidatus Magasanikbacteria bacterium]|nr:TatD family hydrolase [Candidatus Magasanikbacteria bacterium]